MAPAASAAASAMPGDEGKVGSSGVRRGGSWADARLASGSPSEFMEAAMEGRAEGEAVGGSRVAGKGRDGAIRKGEAIAGDI